MPRKRILPLAVDPIVSPGDKGLPSAEDALPTDDISDGQNPADPMGLLEAEEAAKTKKK